MSRDITRRPRQDSNLRTRLRRPVLYPLSYGGGGCRDRNDQVRGSSVHDTHRSILPGVGTEGELAAATAEALRDLGLKCDESDVRLERPQRLEHGDWSTNAALSFAKAAHKNPRDLADQVAAALAARPPRNMVGVEVAGPGFINFLLSPSWLHETLEDVLAAGESGYAAPDLGGGETVQIEFVSANPTGPLHVGNGWFASYGDALARIMSRAGWMVSREYYVNDTGGQIRRLGQSVLARRRREQVPEEGYQGEYVAALAESYDGPDDELEAGRFAAERILENIKETLASLHIAFDEWYSQAAIEESGQVEETIEALRRAHHVYDHEGAVWLRSTTFGDARDRVLVRSSGEPTYLAGDLAYHRDKFLIRGFDRVIDVLGADHHGQIASLKAGLAGLGVDPDRLEVRIGQMVSLVGVTMSKRSGHFVSMGDLIDLLGPDAARLATLLSSIDQATTIDLDKVAARSAENPVFYVQYAHARIASIGRVAKERGIERVPLEEADLSLLVHPRELEVLRVLSDLPRVVREAAMERAPYKVTNWVRALASAFHGFYHDCYVMGDDVPAELTAARLWFVEGARIGLAIGLDLLGVTAPEQM